jgi:hypothetical protein
VPFYFAHSAIFRDCSVGLSVFRPWSFDTGVKEPGRIGKKWKYIVRWDDNMEFVGMNSEALYNAEQFPKTEL